MKRQKAIEQKLDCEFIGNDPVKEEFNVFKAIKKLFKHVKQSSNELTKKTLIDKILMRLLQLIFKSDNTINSKAIKYIFKKILPVYK